MFTVDRLVWFNWLAGGVGFVYVLLLGLCLFGMILRFVLFGLLVLWYWYVFGLRCLIAGLLFAYCCWC